MEIFSKNPLYANVKMPTIKTVEPLTQKLANLDKAALSLLKKCLRYDPEERESAANLLKHPYFDSLSLLACFLSLRSLSFLSVWLSG
jgi:serine/threonine protein kinase